MDIIIPTKRDRSRYRNRAQCQADLFHCRKCQMVDVCWYNFDLFDVTLAFDAHAALWVKYNIEHTKGSHSYSFSVSFCLFWSFNIISFLFQLFFFFSLLSIFLSTFFSPGVGIVERIYSGSKMYLCIFVLLAISSTRE